MAIKGKSRGRTGRTVTPGPKPVYTPVKTPLLAKRGFWITLGSILGVALIAGLVVAWLIQRDADADAELRKRMQTAVNQYQGALAPILQTLGQPVPPASFSGFPELTQAVTDLENETRDEMVDARQLQRTAENTLQSVRNGQLALEEIDASGLVQGKGFSEDFAVYVIDSKRDIIRALSLYREAALLVQMAADAEGKQREELVARARGVTDAATGLLSDGYSAFVQAQAKAGLFDASALQPAGPTGQIP
ncbi:MAG TPA: hypothetical protein VJ774_04520 [Actinomycetota bacterium]|nr:hypothetical protein [Actinomycetota bacterium]